MSRPIKLRLSAAALQHNLTIVRRHAHNSKIMAVVKANAYGHGLYFVANTLQKAGVDALAVCSIDEALALYEEGISLPVILLEGFFADYEIPVIAQYDFIPVIHSLAQIDALIKIKPKIKIVLKLNTGTNRLGIDPENWQSVQDKLKEHKSIEVEMVMTHFANADEIDNPANKQQISVFDQYTKGMQQQQSLANSAAIVTLPASHRHWVRPGIMLYGANPLLSGSAYQLDLKPVMSFESEVIAIRKLRAGDAVGYGGTWTCKQECMIAVVAAGYGDGYPRHATNGTPVLINGHKCQLAGRVSMDMITVDVSHLSNVKIGDKVELWGDNIPADEVASNAGTIAYELFCSITERVPREHGD